MSWRTVVISKRSKLDLQLGYMVVRGETTRKVHLCEISTLIVESTAVAMTAALLVELTQRNVKVIFCDTKHNPSAELVDCYGAHDASGKLRQQLLWSDGVKQGVWTEIIREKIRAQSNVLEKTDRAEASQLRQYIRDVAFNDTTNREAHAAKVYFNALFGKDFSRAAPNTVNAALNYGYAVLLSACNRHIVAAGYITQIGLHHSNTFNLFNFGSDIMEPLRPFIDYIVYMLWQDGKLERFETEAKHALLSQMDCTILVDGKRQIFNYAIGLFCKSVFDSLNQEDIGLLLRCDFLEDGE